MSWLPTRFHVIPPVLGLVLFNGVGFTVMGAWRIGIDRERPEALVTRGIFGWSRNPINLRIELCALGTVLLQGRLVFLVTVLILVATLHALIRREEHTSFAPIPIRIGGTAPVSIAT